MRKRGAFSSGPSSAYALASIINPYWKQVVYRFEDAGFPQVHNTTRVVFDEGVHDSCRHYAAARTDGKVLMLAPEVVDLPDEDIWALLAHEAGHFVDFASPGRFFHREPTRVRMREGASVEMLSELSERMPPSALFRFVELPGKLGKHMREWKERDADEVEFVADGIASLAMGIPIRYRGPADCLVETFGPGVERPLGLR